MNDSFKEFLNQNTNTPDDLWVKEQKLITKTVNDDYDEIKKKILDSAQRGFYKTVGEEKLIKVYQRCKYLDKCVSYSEKDIIYPKLFGNPPKSTECTTYISKKREYYLYTSMLKELTSKDEVEMQIYFCFPPFLDKYYELPYTRTGILGSRWPEFGVECTIKY